MNLRFRRRLSKMVRLAPGPIVALLLLVVAAAAVYVMHKPRTLSARASVVNVLPSDIGGPFELVDSQGRAVSDRDFRGKWLLIFFGYTHCPDVCPTTLSDIAETLTQLGPLAGQVQPLFITV